MKKFILTIMFSVLLIMSFGCQSETPVQTNDNSILPLEKPSIVVGANCYSDTLLNVNWTSIGGAKEYRIYRLPTANELGTELAVIPPIHGHKTYTYTVNVSSWSGRYYTIRVDAFNGKGVAISSTTANVSLY
ncbi:MAG: hypothetical protein P8Z35_02475 [Ignavibacteriaceae bacterium]